MRNDAQTCEASDVWITNRLLNCRRNHCPVWCRHHELVSNGVKSSCRPIDQGASGFPQTADMTMALGVFGSGPNRPFVTRCGLLSEAA